MHLLMEFQIIIILEDFINYSTTNFFTIADLKNQFITKYNILNTNQALNIIFGNRLGTPFSFIIQANGRFRDSHSGFEIDFLPKNNVTQQTYLTEAFNYADMNKFGFSVEQTYSCNGVTVIGNPKILKKRINAAAITNGEFTYDVQIQKNH